MRVDYLLDFVLDSLKLDGGDGAVIFPEVMLMPCRREMNVYCRQD